MGGFMRNAVVSAVTVTALLIATGSASAATITVNTTDDTSPTDCTLRNAITAANDDAASGACTAGSGSDTVQITATGTITLDSALPTVTSGMSVVGSAAGDIQVLSGGDFRVFTVDTPSDVEISGLTIAHGRGVTVGGGIRHQGGGTLVLDGVLVTQNFATDIQNATRAEAYGAGIYNEAGSSLEVHNSTISANEVSAITTNTNNDSIAYGSAIESRGPLSIDASTIEGNDSNLGSQFFSEGAGAVSTRAGATITNSTISANTVMADTSGGSGNANVFGGGLYNLDLGSGGPLTLENDTIANNVLSSTGTSSGLERGGGIATINLGGSIESSTIAGNSADHSGANVFLNAPDETLTFENTIVSGGMGGAQNCSADNGSFDSLGYNLEDDTAAFCGFTETTDIISEDPLLGPLGDNGGPTPTMSPPFNSPVIDHGVSTGETSDQRDQQRPRDYLPVGNAAGGDGSDIGAVERQTTDRDPARLVFGAQLAGTTSASQTLTVINRTFDSLSISPATLGGSNASDFSITNDGCVGTLAMGEECDVDVAFSPQASTSGGTKAASVQIADGESLTPLTVGLRGTALASPVSPVSGPAPTAPSPTHKKKCKKGKKKHRAAGAKKKKKCKKKKRRK
jgi:hypothetical protein